MRIFLDSPDANGNRGGNWYVYYATSLFTRFAGMGAINGDDPPTLSFDAVRLPDGRTPEEAGLTLRFASGITSPNEPQTIATPEPTSVTLMGTGLVILLFVRLFRRQSQAELVAASSSS